MAEACDIFATGSYLSGQSGLPGTTPITPYRHQPQTPQRTGDIPNPLSNRYRTNVISLGLNSDSWSLHSRWSLHCSCSFRRSWFLHSNGSFRSDIAYGG